MAPPIYFFPASSKDQLAPGGRLDRDKLRQFGLDRHFGDLGSVTEDASLLELTVAGPGGASGCFLMAIPPGGQVPVRLGFYPDFQDWTEQEGMEKSFWVGLDKEHPPAAADLLRKKTFGGYQLELAGGEVFEVPVIRDPEGGTSLPRDFAIAADGSIEAEVKATYRETWERFAVPVGWLFDPEGPDAIAMDADTMSLCLAALAINYRVGRPEQNLLHLVDSENWQSILFAAVDVPTFRDVLVRVCEQKKTRDASSSPTGGPGSSPGSTPDPPAPPAPTGTSDGSGDSCPATAPATENSDSPPSASEPPTPSSTNTTLPGI